MIIKRITESINQSNGYVIHEADGQEAVIIDACNFALLDAYLQEKSLSLRYLILTHEHHDHINGVNAFRRAYPEMKLIASQSCSKGIQNSRLNFTRSYAGYLYYRKHGVKRQFGEFTCGPADWIIGNREVISWREHSFVFYITPGHSPGSISIVLDEEYLFSGDSLLKDRGAELRFPGGDRDAYQAVTLSFYQTLKKDLKVFPGHGESFFMQDAYADRNFLKEVF